MKARFNKVKNRYVNKFSFDNNTTLGIGNVQPLFCKQLAGGSKVSVNFGQLTRLSPLVVPTFARLKQRNDFVFVPISMVMPSFDAFLSSTSINGIHKTYIPNSLPCITNQALFFALIRNYASVSKFNNSGYVKSSISSIKIEYYATTSQFAAIPNVFNGVADSDLPTFAKLPKTYWDFILDSHNVAFSTWSSESCCVKLNQAGRFWYTVLRGLGYTCDPDDTTPVSLLPLWAFAKAYYDVYYPKRSNPWHMSNYYNFINSFYNGNFNSVSVGSLTIDFVKDYSNVLSGLFTTGFDFYATIDDNLATVATATPINDGSKASNNNSFDNANKTEAPLVLHYQSSNASNVPIIGNYPGGNQLNAVSADQLSLVHRLWNFVQKSSVVGQSVKDWFAVHLGQQTNEDMFDQTILVQSVTNDVSINPVISTAQTTDGEKGDNLGALAGQGFAQKNGQISFEARTFGYFMCLSSLVPVSGCSCGTNPELYCNTLYEQQLPDFDGVGYEALNKSSFSESIVESNFRKYYDSLSGGFGYVPRLSSWKTIHSVRSGNFAINSVKDSFLPYCVDVLPLKPMTASTLWRYPWSNSGNFMSFNRIFYNGEPSIDWTYAPFIPLPLLIDDNFMSQSVFDFTYTSYLKPLSDSYSIESLGNDLISVKEQ